MPLASLCGPGQGRRLVVTHHRARRATTRRWGLALPGEPCAPMQARVGKTVIERRWGRPWHCTCTAARVVSCGGWSSGRATAAMFDRSELGLARLDLTVLPLPLVRLRFLQLLRVELPIDTRGVTPRRPPI